MLHQEPRGVELEQPAEADDGHQELPDDDALDGADHAQADAGKNLRQGGEDIDLAEGLPAGCAEHLGHFNQRRRDAAHPGPGVQHDEIGRAHVEIQSLMRRSYAVFCLKKNTTITYTDSNSYIMTHTT